MFLSNVKRTDWGSPVLSDSQEGRRLTPPRRTRLAFASSWTRAVRRAPEDPQSP